MGSGRDGGYGTGCQEPEGHRKRSGSVMGADDMRIDAEVPDSLGRPGAKGEGRGRGGKCG